MTSLVRDWRETALRLHREAPPIDLHTDTLLWSRFFGYDLLKRHTPPFPWSSLLGQADLPRFQEAGFGAVFFGLVSLPYLDRDYTAACHREIDLLDAAITASAGELKLARLASDIGPSGHATPLAAFLGIEGAHALKGRLSELDAFAKRGLRYLGLVHFSANEAASPAAGVGADAEKGLTKFGFDLVARCEELGVILDLAHLNRRGFKDVFGVATKPMMVTHTGVAGANAHWRNIDDDQIRGVADRGGVIGIIFCPYYLGRDGVDAVAEHIEHVIRIAGEDAVALGSDWDGFIRPTRGLEEPQKLPNLTEALLRRGLSETACKKLLRHNVLRVLGDTAP